MSVRIEWEDTRTPARYTGQPGEWTDAFGSSNAGPALAVGDCVVEAPSALELVQWLIAAVRSIVDLNEFEVDVDGDRNEDPYLLCPSCHRPVCEIEEGDTLLAVLRTAVSHDCGEVK